jgi:PAS domain S-box-containing protein
VNERCDSPGGWFWGETEMHGRCRALDWSGTALGPVEGWPGSLRTVVQLCLDSRVQMAVWAGPELALIYNDAYSATLGPDKHPHALGRPGREVWTEHWGWLEPELERVRRGGESLRHEDERLVMTRAGRDVETFFSYSLTPVREPDGTIVGVLNVVRESTEHVRGTVDHEQALAFALAAARAGAWELDLGDQGAGRSRARERSVGLDPLVDTLRAVLEAVPVAVVVADARGRILLTSAATRQVLGGPVTGNAHGPRGGYRVLRPDRTEVPVGQLPLSRALRGEEVVDEALVVRHVDGTEIDIRASATPLRAAGGGLYGAVTLFHDVSEHKRGKAALRRSEERYRVLFESIDEGFCIIEMIFEGERPVDYRFLRVNPAFERHTGLTDAPGKRIREMVPRHEEYWFERYGRVATTGEPARFENAAEALGRFYDVFAFRVGAPEQRQVAVLFNDITQRKRAEVALREANDRLIEADQRKDEFLAVLSHELRNPLAPILNGVSILERAEPGGVQAIRAREVIERQAQHMARLIEDLLDVTRISRGKIVLQRERVDLNAIARRTTEDHRELFARAGVELEIVEPGEPLWVDGDGTRLAQVIGNLLSNAAKFTPRGGRTVLALEEGASEVAVVRVRDSGAGFLPGTRERLFEPFVQGAQTIERTRGGLGLGLALVKRLAELHGGTVTAHSEGEGRGSEFVVTLPLQAPATPKVDVGGHGAMRPRARRVLVIEDNVDSAESLREVLQLSGHEVTVVYSGAQGLEAARAHGPDIILCDIGLPGMDGYEVARSIRAAGDATLRETFLVALSGYASAADVRKSSEAGFDRHVGKPPTLELLEKLIDDAPARRGGGTPLAS